jgi:GAF domain-containing protein
MGEAMTLVGAKRGYIVLLRADGTLDFRVKRGTHHDGTPLSEDQVSTSIVREVIETAQPLVVSNARSDPRWQQVRSVALLGLRSVMRVPLITHGETIGAIYVENRKYQNCFDADDLPPLILFDVSSG